MYSQFMLQLEVFKVCKYISVFFLAVKVTENNIFFYMK